ncbi:MAG: hypothetical protein ACI8P9_002656 [Parasphingorhabdus sp.]
MKVLILGLAKSGTTALAYKIHESMPDGAELEFEPGKTKGAEDLQLHNRITASNRPVVTKNLIYPDQQTRWQEIWANVAKYDRAIWIVRDPRDILISNFFYHWYQGYQVDKQAFELALKRTQQKEQSPSSMAFIDLVAGTMTKDRDQLQAWQQSWYDILNGAAETIQQRMHILKYEDFVDGRVDGLSEYLGISIEGETEVPDEHKRVIRTRGYDNWRRWFTNEDVEFFTPLISSFLQRMGYDHEDWKLIPCDTLPSAEGSEYMQDMFKRGRGTARSSKSWLRRFARRVKAKLQSL